MAEFRYRAQTDEHEPVEGSIEETSAYRARQRLEERGLRVLTVETTRVLPGLFRESGRLQWDELAIVLEQLHTLTKSSLPIGPALQKLAGELRRPAIRQALERVASDTEQGRTLDEAMDRNPHAFPPLFTSAIRAGEASGNMPGVIELLIDYSRRMDRTRRAIIQAMVYPAIVTVCSLLLTLFLAISVLPAYADLFATSRLPLPALTRGLYGFGLFARDYPHLLALVALVVVGCLVAGLRALQRSETGRQWLDSVLLHAPMLGRSRYLRSVARFAQTLHILLRARVPPVDGLTLAAAVSGSPVLEQAAGNAARDLASGVRLSDSLGATGFFPADFCCVIQFGEERNGLEDALANAAESVEREAEASETAAFGMISPLMTFLVGLVLLVIALAIYMPLVGVTEMADVL